MINGMINVYKEQGYTSFDVVAKLRGILKTKKIGHTGTLDPMAEGVLPVCVGNATKLCELLMDHDKKYRAGIVFGYTTDTLDTTGEITRKCDMKVTEEELLNAFEKLTGTYEQIPPIYSAIKVNGKKLYEYARSGKDVEIKGRLITVGSISPVSIMERDTDGYITRAILDIECGKGTYIRSLCRDIGEALGGAACMYSLVRLKTGMFEADKAFKLSEIERYMSEGRIDEIITNTDEFYSEYPKVMTTPEADYLLHNGNPLKKSMLVEKPQKADCYRLYDSTGVFFGIYNERPGSNLYFPEKMFIS